MANLKNNAEAVNADRERLRKVYDRSLREESRMLWGADHARLVRLSAELYKMHQKKSEEMAMKNGAKNGRAPRTNGHAR